MQLCSSLNILRIAFLWHFQSVATAVFSKFVGILSAALTQHHLLAFEIAQLEFHHLLALFVVMLSKAHLTSHSRMSGSKCVITPLWLSWSWRSFLYSSYVYSCHLFLDCSPPGSTNHGILQARILEQVAISSTPNQGSNLGLLHLLHCRRILYHWATGDI